MSHVEQRPPRHQRQSSRIVTLLSSPSSKQNHDRRDLVTNSRSADDATIAYIKRTLCQKSSKRDFLGGDDLSGKRLDELLPPLTSSNEIDVQLYAIIAVILNQVVQSWYNRITPDGDFVGEIVQIIAHCSRGLEERLRHVDLEAFVLDELPALIDAHILAVMVACEANDLPHEPSQLQNRLWLIYNSLRPHHAMTPAPLDATSSLAQGENEVAWCRLVVTSVIPLVLPPEDLLNPCLHVLVSEIFSEMIFHNALCGKVTEPWLLWDGVTKLIYALVPSSQPHAESVPSPSSRLDKFGLLSSSSRVNKQNMRSSQHRTIEAAGNVFWSILQYALLALTLSRTFLTALINASSLPMRPGGESGRESLAKRRYVSIDDPKIEALSASEDSRAILSMWLWACICHLISFERRMPWLTGVLSLLQWLSLHGPGQICRTNGPIDRLLSYHIHDKLLNPALLPSLLHATRTALFPNNTLAPTKPPPSTAETLAIKHECARCIVAALPLSVSTIFFATDDPLQMQQDVEKTLELFGDQYLNKNLIVAIVDAVVAKLFPELLAGT